MRIIPAKLEAVKAKKEQIIATKETEQRNLHDGWIYPAFFVPKNFYKFLVISKTD